MNATPTQLRAPSTSTQRPCRPLPLTARLWSMLGRRQALTRVLRHAWQSLVEVSPGGGHDLLYLAQFRPSASFGAISERDKDLRKTQARCPWAVTQKGHATAHVYPDLLETKPDRVLFTYSLGTLADPLGALKNARKNLAIGGEVIVIDFWHLEQCPEWLRPILQPVLRACGVRPLSRSLLAHFDASVEAGPLGLWALARIKRA